MSENTIIFGASDDQILFDGRIYEQFDDYAPKKAMLECSDGTRFSVHYKRDWKFELLHAGPAFMELLDASQREGEYSDKVTMGPIDWVKYADDEGHIQRAYATGIPNPVAEIRKIIERYDEYEAAELIQQLFEKRTAA